MTGRGAGPPAPETARHHTAFVPLGDRLLALLDTVRGRLAGLVLVSAVPLLLLSGTIAWQNYELALGASRDRVSRLLQSAIARHAAAIDLAHNMMQSLAQSADIFGQNEEICHRLMVGAISLQTARYSNLVARKKDGTYYCGARPKPPNYTASLPAVMALYDKARSTGTMTIGAVQRSRTTGELVIPVVYPVVQGGAVQGFLSAGLRMDWFTGDENGTAPELAAVWLYSPHGDLTQLAASGADSLPPPDVLDRLLKAPADEVAMVASRRGAPYAYAATPVAGDFHLLVASPASEDQAQALWVLLRRLAQLSILLGLGLAAIAIGTHRALVQPMDQLATAVQRWRAGGVFDPELVHTPPVEVRQLALSFAEATRSLAEQSDKLTASREQQDLLMREIHHRVKNNLQIVASLLNLQASRIKLPAARAEFASARDRVRALATLHRHLYTEGDLSSINMRSFLKELCQQLFDAMGERPGGRIGLTIEATDLEMSSDQAVPLSLIVTEAVSNTLKYAFPHGRLGHVAVFLSAAEGIATLVIQDDGIGIPAGTAETETGTRDGLGIQLIRGFSRQLGATLDVHEDGGTTYRVTFPLKGGSAELPDPSL